MTEDQAGDKIEEYFSAEDLASEEVIKLLESFSKNELTNKQKLFCLYYNTIDDDTFRNQVKSYVKAYGKSDDANVRSRASRIMKSRRISTGLKLAEKYLNPTFYDKIKIEQEHWKQYEKADVDGRHKDAIKMLELMGKSVNFYSGEKEDKGADNERANEAQKALSIEKTKIVDFWEEKKNGTK